MCTEAVHTHETGSHPRHRQAVVTPGGSTYSFDEIREGLEEAGFKNIRLIRPDEQMNGLIEAFT
jgi:hypothetical protein